MIVYRHGQTSQKKTADHPLRIPLADLGGLTQIGAHLETLEPGEGSSDRHWHEQSDELLLVLSGEVTVLDEAGRHRLGPGDAAAWPAGVADAHTVRNLTDRPATYLIVGTRMARDRVHYPESGRVLTDADGSWTLTEADGTVIASGILEDPRPLGVSSDPEPPSD